MLTYTYIYAYEHGYYQNKMRYNRTRFIKRASALYPDCRVVMACTHLSSYLS